MLVVDEGRRTGGLSEAVFTSLIERLSPDVPATRRVVGDDVYIPLGDAWKHVLPSEARIVSEAASLAAAPKPAPV